MGKQLKEITLELQQFIESQKVFFVGTAMSQGKVNISPKGMDSLRVLNPNRVIWLNLTGSGNETAAHLLENSRMTIMFCAFDGKPLILRLYGNAKVHHQRDSEWDKYISMFPENKSARQILDLEIKLVQTSCGFGVPLMNFDSDRDLLEKWADNKEKKDIEDYWQEKNKTSLDGHPTGII